MKRMVGKWKRRWHRLSVITRTIIIMLILVLVALRIALPHLVQRYVNHKLDELPGYAGSIGEVDIHLWRGAYSIHEVNVMKETNRVPIPFVAARRVDLSVEWRELRHGALVGEVIADEAQLNFVKAPSPDADQTSIDKSWTEVVEDLFPFKINRVLLRDSAVRFRDLKAEPRVDVFVTNMTFVCSNITNSRGLTNELPTAFSVTGETIGGGRAMVYGRINPFTESPRFDVNAALENVDLTALNDLLRAYANVDVKRGRLRVFTEMAAADGRFKGYVKPLLEDLDVVELEEAKNPLQFIWEAFVAGVVKLFKNQPSDRFAGEIPLEGDLENPEAGILPTVVSVLRNAFVQALSPRLEQKINLESAKPEKGTRPPPKRDTSKDNE